MSEKSLKILIYLAGILGLAGIIAIRSLPVMNAMIPEKIIPEHWEFTRYGELYYFSCIPKFREDLPAPIRKYRFSEKHPGLSEADILMFGDSFLDISRQTTLPERLADTLGIRVFFHRFLEPQRSNPFCVITGEGMSDPGAKILIYQTVERNIPMKFDRPYNDSMCVEPDSTGTLEAISGRVVNTIFRENTEELYKQLLKRSYLTSALYSLNAGIKFDLFGYISSQTPLYRTGEQQPWLFHYRQLNEEPGSFYYQYTGEEIDRYCDNIAWLASRVEEELGMKMIFLPVPNKYTIYHHVINDDPYNDFLPMLYEGLHNRDVSYVDLYSEYMNSREVLYYGTDTHWNRKGVDIALRKVVEEINRISQ